MPMCRSRDQVISMRPRRASSNARGTGWFDGHDQKRDFGLYQPSQDPEMRLWHGRGAGVLHSQFRQAMRWP